MLNRSTQTKIDNDQSNLNPRSRLKDWLNAYLKLFIPNQCYQNVTSENGADSIPAPEANSKLLHWPLIIFTISVVQLFVFNYDLVQTNEHKSNLTIEHIGRSYNGPLTKLLIFDPDKRHEYWRYLTYSFVHVGFYHLFGNIVVQVFVGLPLEIRYGSPRILILYMLSVICAAKIQTSINPTIYLAGGSGAVYALFGAHIATIIINWKNIYSPDLQLLCFVLIGIIDICLSLGSNSISTSYISHLVGFITGFILELDLHKKLKRILNRLPKNVWKYVVLVIIFGSGVLIFLTRSLVFETMNQNTTDSGKFTTSQNLTVLMLN